MAAVGAAGGWRSRCVNRCTDRNGHLSFRHFRRCRPLEKGECHRQGHPSRATIRFPTLNDLYFLPGGNINLKKEHGFTYDGGVEFTVGRKNSYSLHGEATWFDSYIDDWIVWLPTFKGFWSPSNIKRVHAYGIELKGSLDWLVATDWHLLLNGNFSWTPSINHGDPVSWGDASIGKQLVYVPKFSAAVNAQLDWKTWSLGYKWCHYSERFTTSSNETKTKIYRISPYFMSDVTLEKRFEALGELFGQGACQKHLRRGVSIGTPASDAGHQLRTFP